jgi:hypothetical protein
VDARDPSDVSAVLVAISEFAEVEGEWEVVRRQADRVRWPDGAEAPSLHVPQLVRHPALETWLGATLLDGGAPAACIGVLRGEECEIVIVSDPDLISNHGLVREDGVNARIAVGLVEKLLRGPRRVVVDESCHGAGLESGFWREALRFPMVLVLLHVALLSGAILWGALGRFGPPTPERVGLAAGSRTLIDSTAELLRFGGHRREALRRYLRVVVDGLCRRRRGPETGLLLDRVRWLAERARTRGVETDIERLAAAIGSFPAAGSEDWALDIALGIERFRGEFGDGPGDRGDR